jgi:hypothetical protein
MENSRHHRDFVLLALCEESLKPADQVRFDDNLEVLPHVTASVLKRLACDAPGWAA